MRQLPPPFAALTKTSTASPSAQPRRQLSTVSAMLDPARTEAALWMSYGRS